MSNIAKSPYRVKAQLKCFRCKQACNPKDGTWVRESSREIFLCKKCDANHASNSKKSF